MAHLLKANTAVDVLIGPFVDSTDGNTDETGLTISQADVRLSKNGQNMAQKNDANACTHDELGYYNCPLDATDTNTEGQLDVIVHESGALHTVLRCSVISEAAWDSLFAAKDTGYMDVNVKAVSEDTTAADNLESACDNYSVTRGLTGTALPAAAADAAGGLVISDAGGQDIDTAISNIAAILTDTGEIGAAGAGLTAVPWNAAWDAEVQSECNDALVALNLDHLLAVADADDVVDNSVIAKLAASGATADWSTFVNTTDSLQATRDHIGDGTNLTEAGGDGDHLTEAGGDGDHLVEAGGTGDQLTAVPWNAAWDAEVQSEVTDALGVSGTLSGVAIDDMIDRIYTILLHKMNVTDADGSVALRDSGDTGDIATGSITDNATITVRAALSFS